MRLRALLLALIVVASAAFAVGTTIERNNAHSESAAQLRAEAAAAHTSESAAHVKAEQHAVADARRRAAARRRTSAKTAKAAARAADPHAGESAAHRAAEGLPPETPAPRTPTAAHAGESAAHHAAEGLAPKTTATTASPRARTRRAPSTAPGDTGTGESAAHRAAEGTHTGAHRELRPLGVDIEAVPFVVLAVLASLGLAAAAWARPRWLLLLGVLAATMLAFSVLDVREVFHQRDESQTGLAILAAVVAALHLAAAAVAGLMASTARRPAG